MVSGSVSVPISLLQQLMTWRICWSACKFALRWHICTGRLVYDNGGNTLLHLHISRIDVCVYEGRGMGEEKEGCGIG